jgi:hypothetical protein
MACPFLDPVRQAFEGGSEACRTASRALRSIRVHLIPLHETGGWSMPERDVLTDEWLSKLLSDLGDTAYAVAERLRKEEIKGVRGDPNDCPIARYVAKRVRKHGTSLPVRVTVTASTVSVFIGTPGADDYRVISALTTEAMEDFIKAFDDRDGSAPYADLALPAAS